MSFKRLMLFVALVSLGFGATAHAATAPHPVNGGGGQLHIGNGLPLPVQFPPAPVSGPTFPPLLIPVAGGATVMQPTTPGVLPASPKSLIIPQGVLFKPASANTVGVFLANPAVFQVATSLTFTWPRGGATLAAGGRTGMPVQAYNGPGPGIITYTAGAAQFGGPAQFTLLGGAGGAAGLIPGAPITVWINAFMQAPATAMTAVIVPAYVGANGAAAGAAVGFATGTAGVPGAPASIAARGFAGVNALGSVITPSGGAPGPVLNNMATTSSGFPWTTGMLTVAQPAAVPAEIFVLTGSDGRNTTGSGTISMVSGALSLRQLSLANANRGWVQLTLPEPTVALGALGAFGMLGFCHTLARRRSSR
jgi:hypothetical protein